MTSSVQPEQRRPRPMVWKSGQLVPGSIDQFTRSLRRFAGYAEREFSTRSDPAGLLSERLNAAADLIDTLVSGPDEDTRS